MHKRNDKGRKIREEIKNKEYFAKKKCFAQLYENKLKTWMKCISRKT